MHKLCINKQQAVDYHTIGKSIFDVGVLGAVKILARKIPKPSKVCQEMRVG
jgi:hypothetical protein